MTLAPGYDDIPTPDPSVSRPSLARYQFWFNGLTMGPGTALEVQKFEGLDQPKSTAATPDDPATWDGSSASTRWTGGTSSSHASSPPADGPRSPRPPFEAGPQNPAVHQRAAARPARLHVPCTEAQHVDRRLVRARQLG
jgi:hypothetical protein